MVVRVYGSVNGSDVIFTPLGDDLWDVTVPKLPGGEYVCDLYAEDDAGNIGYAATILFIVNAKHIITEIRWLRFSADPAMRELEVVGKVACREADAQVTNIECVGSVREFKMDVVRCEICGGDMFGMLDNYDI